MIKTLAEAFIKQRTTMEGTINAQMGMQLVNIDEQQQEISFVFSVEPWQLNPFGTMHGGLIAAAADMAMGCAAYASNGGHPSPTADMQIRYLKGIQAGSVLQAKAKMLHVGKKLAQVQVDLYQGEELVATASGAYFALSNTNKEEK